MTLRLSRTFLGTASRERECAGFRLALRRATVPAEAVPEHAHETAHMILAIDDDYVSDAVGAAAWRGPAMLVYNPPGTVHRDRFGATLGRFVSIDFPPGFEPGDVIDAVVVQSGVARRRAVAVLAALLDDDCAALDTEDRLLKLSAALAGGGPGAGAPPDWLRIASEAIRDLADEAELRVQDIARLAGVHPVHLARGFARHLGCSPGEAIRRTRVERVAAALAGGRPIAALAHEHGFADHAHLTRCFRARYGANPSVFRASFD